MSGKEYWSFLEEFDGNLLYRYVSDNNDTGYFVKRENIFYLIWFVYRYVLNCETLEEALKYADIQTIKRFKLARVFTKDARYDREANLSLGSKQLGEIDLSVTRKYLESEKVNGFIHTVIEIVYNRYNYLEQLECYIKHFSINAHTSKQPKSVIEAKKILKSSIEYMENNPKFEEILLQYRKSRKEILGDFYYE